MFIDKIAGIAKCAGMGVTASTTERKINFSPDLEVQVRGVYSTSITYGT